MGKVIQLASYRKACEHKPNLEANDQQLERNQARLLIYQASALLSKVDDEAAQKIVWVLEDCADSLAQGVQAVSSAH